MKLLLDTHVLLWWLKEPESLSTEARNAIQDPAHAVYYSTASIWEITIKSALGKLPRLDRALVTSALQDDGIRPMVISPEHAWLAGDLPLHHNDPFDRMLVAQARHESLRLVTRDSKMKPYGIDLLPA